MQVPPRIYLDLYTEDQAGEVERLLALGATEVHWAKRSPDADYVILGRSGGQPLLRRGHRSCVTQTDPFAPAFRVDDARDRGGAPTARSSPAREGAIRPRIRTSCAR